MAFSALRIKDRWAGGSRRGAQRALTGSALFALLAALCVVVVPSASATAQTNCTGFSACASAGYPNYGYSSVYTKSYWGQDAGHNCTNYVAYRFHNVGVAKPSWLGTGNADEWGVWASKLTNSTPTVGSIAWWSSSSAYGSYGGHVSIVEKVNSNGSFIDSDDNYGGDFHWRTYSPGSSDWPSGFIHLSDSSLNDGFAGGGTTPPPPDKDGDGVPDSSDLCPLFPGLKITDGCPPEQYDSSFIGSANGSGRSNVSVFYDYGGALTRGFAFPGTANSLSNSTNTFWDSGAGNFDDSRARFVSGDFNGDGFTDVAAFYDYGGGDTGGWLLKGTASGLSSKWTEFFDSGAGNFEDSRARFVVGDFNGDGRADVAVFYDYGGGETRGFVFDGTASGLSSTLTPFWDSGAGNWDTNTRARFVSGDFNGDGFTDVAAFYDYGGGETRGWLLKGTASGLSSKWTEFFDSGAGNFEDSRARFVAGDFNGDGRADVAVFYDYGGGETRGFAFTGTASGLSSSTNTFWDSGSGNFYDSHARFVTGDFNGDGRTDVAAFYDYGGSETRGWLLKGTANGLSSAWTEFFDSGAGNFSNSLAQFVSSGSAGLPTPASTQAPAPTQTASPAHVTHCVVPKLHGMTLKHARRALKARHCALGSVHRPLHHRRRLRVTHQSAKAGSRHKRGYHVSVKLRRE